MKTSPLTPSELEFARLAIERGLITTGQVRECVERQRDGEAGHLGNLLTRAGHLEASAAAGLLREVHRKITQQTTLALAADMERYLVGMQLTATGGRQPASRRRRLTSTSVVAGVAAVALALVGGGASHARWTRTQVIGCGPLPQRHDLERFIDEVMSQCVAARALIASAAAARHGGLEVAQAEAEGAIRILDELPLLLRGFDPELRPALEAYLGEEQPERDGIYRDAYLALARSHADRGGPDQLAKALAALRLALVRAPGDPDALLDLARVQSLQGEHDQARRTLQTILDAAPAHVDARLELGRVHEATGDDEAALGCFTHVIERGAKPARAHQLRGEARFRLGLTRPALEDFERVVAIDADSYQGYLWLGRALQACGHLAEAQESLTEAIDLNPALPDAYTARGELNAARRRHDAAILDFEVALSRSPQHHPARLSLGHALQEVLDHERARATYEELLRATDREAQALAPAAHAALGELWLVQADSFECEREARAEVRRRAAAADDTLGPWPPVSRTREDAARLRGERLRAAADQLSRALALAPELVPALLARGRLALAQGALDAAQVDLRAAVAVLERRPRDEQASRRPLACAQALLGLVALRAGQPAAAQLAFARALEAQPTCALALAGLGLVALRAGDADAAREQLARARGVEAAFFTREGERHADLTRRSRRPDAYAMARRCFARAVHENPLDARADLARAALCAEWGSWDDAVALATRAVASDPLLREGHERLGFLFARDLPLERDPTTGHPGHLRDLTRAEAHFSDALALARGDVDASCDAFFGRALARSAADPTGARADLRAALRAIPVDLREAAPARVRRSIEALDLLTAAQERAGDLDAARACRDQAGALRRAARAAAREELEAAQQLRERLDHKAAIERTDRALELDPDLAAGHQLRGTCYLKIGNFVPGILDLSRALELDPRLTDGFFHKVYQTSCVVDLNRVITELTKIVSDHPGVAHVIFLRGFFYVAKTEFKRFDRLDVERGLADLDRCLELNPEHVTALLYRGLLHFKSAALQPTPAGREPCYERAMADYQAALALDPASGVSHYLQALHWSVRSAEPDLPPAEVALRTRRCLDALRASLALEFKARDRVKNEKGFDPVRADPAFAEIMRGE